MKKYKGVVLIEPQPEDARYEQVFGAEIPQPIPDWSQFLPPFENQYNSTFCVSFSRLNIAETVAKKDNLVLNLSDRHLAVLSGTTLNGNDLNSVSEAFRKLGVVKDEVFPFSSDMLMDEKSYWTQIFNTSSIPEESVRYFGGSHSWITGKDNMKSALAYTPCQLAIGVDDHYEQGGVIPVCLQPLAYHCVELYGFDQDDNYLIFDSVNGAVKILDKDYKIAQAKSFRDLPEDWKNAKTPVQSVNWLVDLLRRIASLFSPAIPQQKKAIEILQEVVNEVKVFSNMIQKFALAIEEFEDYVLPGGKFRNGQIAPNGSLSFINKNPGNLKYTHLTQSYGSVHYYGSIGHDSKNFCIFPDYQTGFNALQQFITDAASDKLAAYHSCTIQSFFVSYSGDQNEAKYVAKSLGLPLETKLSTLC